MDRLFFLFPIIILGSSLELSLSASLGGLSRFHRFRTVWKSVRSLAALVCVALLKQG
jgi:hypothetical protein